MEVFNIKTFNDKEILLTECDQVTKLYDTLSKDEAVQFVWIDGNVKKSQIIITGNIAGKIRLGEMLVKSEQVK